MNNNILLLLIGVYLIMQMCNSNKKEKFCNLSGKYYQLNTDNCIENFADSSIDCQNLKKTDLKYRKHCMGKTSVDLKIHEGKFRKSNLTEGKGKQSDSVEVMSRTIPKITFDFGKGNNVIKFSGGIRSSKTDLGKGGKDKISIDKSVSVNDKKGRSSIGSKSSDYFPVKDFIEIPELEIYDYKADPMRY